MSRLLLVVASAFALAAAAAPTIAAAHQGSPNFASVVTSAAPRPAGLTVDVLNNDDRLAVINHTGRAVVVFGYNGEPYARLLADGTVQVNRNSPARYLNEDRFVQGVKIPPGVTARSVPRWALVDRTGRFEWHDHRIHYMTRGVPPQVADTGRRTKVFAWSVPMQVGATKGAIRGELFWVPVDTSGPPAAAIAGLAALVLAGGVLVLVTRRRRRDVPASQARA